VYVCHCRAVTDGAVRAHIAGGDVRSEADLRASCGAGGRCGGCLPTLRRLLADAGIDVEVDADLATCAA
jgi:bacterioferritin-associated ferredoxin